MLKELHFIVFFIFAAGVGGTVIQGATIQLIFKPQVRPYDELSDKLFTGLFTRCFN